MVAVIVVLGLDGLAAGRQLVNNRYVQITVKGHGQCARDGCGGHYQHVRRHVALGPEAGSLSYAKAVLLIDNHKAQTAELYGILKHSVGTYQYVDAAVLESLEDFLAAFALDAARKELGMQAQTVDETADICVMLLGEYLGGGHDAGLVSVVYGNQAGHERNHCLAAAHITLKQAVHLASAAHVVTDLAYHAFLGIGQTEG